MRRGNQGRDTERDWQKQAQDLPCNILPNYFEDKLRQYQAYSLSPVE
jgi:hypothetical protein